MIVTNENYFSQEVEEAYFTNSQIKCWMKCPSQWQAKRKGLYKQPESDALFHGSYVDMALTEPQNFDKYCIDNAEQVFVGKNGAILSRYIDLYFNDPDGFGQFTVENADTVYTKGKYKRSEFKKADEAIAAAQAKDISVREMVDMVKVDLKAGPIATLDKAMARVRRDSYFMEMLSGETQIVIALDDFHGHPFKCKLDVLNWEERRLVDLKTCRDVYGEEWLLLDDGSRAKLSWIFYWKYPMQLALYREAVWIQFDFHPHPYIAATEKKEIPNFDVFDLMATDADAMAFRGELQRGIDAMNEMAEQVDEDPLNLRRCKTCDWCLMNKKLSKAIPVSYDPRILQF